MEINKQNIEKERVIIKDLQYQLAEKDEELAELEMEVAEKDKEINKLKEPKKYVYNYLSFVSNSDATDVDKYIEDLHQTIAQNNEELDEYVKKIVKLKERMEDKDKVIKSLEQQLAEKDKEIEHLKDCNESLSNKFDKESDMQNEIDILKYNVEGLEQQLAEKDEEIERLKAEIKELKDDNWELRKDFNKKAYDYILKDHNKDIRHQVCEEIRDYIHSKECQIKGMEFILLLCKLDQIERGEE